MSDHLTPVEVCERLIGPLPVLEGIVGYRPKAGYAWKRSSGVRAPGDFPSVSIMRRLLTHAAARQIPLTPDHLIWGASSEEIDALIAKPAPDLIEAAE